jgi:hypothetical protein
LQDAAVRAFTQDESTPLPPTMFKHWVAQFPVQGYEVARQSIIVMHLVERSTWLSRQALQG